MGENSNQQNAAVDTGNSAPPTDNSGMFSIDDILWGKDPDLQQSGAVNNDTDKGNHPSENQSVSGSGDDKDKNRYQYWQSEHDKAVNRNQILEQENQQLKNTLAQMMQQVNSQQPGQTPPIAGTQSTETPNEIPSGVELPEPPKPPKRPVKPKDYSHYEATTDPESESAKYLAALDQYNLEVNEYMLAKDQWRDEVARKQQEVQLQAAREQQQMNMWLESAMRAGLQQQETDQFMRFISDPNTYSGENMVRLFQLLRQQNVQTVVQQSVPGTMPVTNEQPQNIHASANGNAVMQFAQQTPFVSPTPASVAGNAQAGNEPPEDLGHAMMKSLIEHDRGSQAF